MTIELKVPNAGESITEVIVVEWLKPEGAHANRDEALALIETDKANLEVLAPASGTLSRIIKKPGDQARVGEVIGLLEPGEQSASASLSTKAVEAPVRQVPVAPPAPRPRVAPEPQTSTRPPERLRLSPSNRRARREAEAHGPTAPSSTAKSEARTPTASITETDGRVDEIVPMTPLRRRVAERLLEAQQNAALLTTFNEVDMSQVIALRKEHQEAFKQKYGIKLGFMSFFVKATVEALRSFPALNAEIRDTNIIYHHYCDIGVAVGGGKGLVVPILRNAERLSVAEIELAIADFGERAKSGRLKVEELQGGTFTISNGGVYGSMMSTPIINPPQSGILGMHAIQERPVVRSGAVAVAPMMYVALTYDHRIVDGREAVSFLVRIKECVENPARILLEV